MPPVVKDPGLTGRRSRQGANNEMRAIVISDIHGNIDALRALESQWGRRLEEFDRVAYLDHLPGKPRLTPRLVR